MVPGMLTETQIVWPVSVAAAHMLKADGHEVMFSRNLAEDVKLTDRAAHANAWGAEVVVSVHANSVESASANGFEVLHYGSEAGERLAQSLLDGLAAANARGDLPEQRNRRLKIRPELDILEFTDAPAALVELEFMSSPTGRAILVDPWYQLAFARAIADGINSYAAAS